MAVGIPGSDRVLVGFLSILRKWVTVERWFCNSPNYADAIDNLRRALKSDKDLVMSICRSHVQVRTLLKFFDVSTAMVFLNQSHILFLTLPSNVTFCIRSFFSYSCNILTVLVMKYNRNLVCLIYL